MSSVKSPEATPGTHPFRLLLVDREEAGRSFLERVLKQPGYETVSAADGFEALRIAESGGPFDLLVTDLAIPGVPGDELARRLRIIDPELKILYVTDQNSRLFEGRTALWEEEAFLDKPVTVQGLLEAVSLMLVGQLPPPRAVRVHVPGGRVRLADSVAHLVRLSATGALVHAVRAVAAGDVHPVTVEAYPERVEVDARVVHCQPLEIAPNDGRFRQPQFVVALAFVEPSARASRKLDKVVKHALSR